MKFFQLSLILATVPVLAPAVTVSYIDPFGAAASSCHVSVCDVVGNKLWFDLESFSLTLDPAAMTGQIVTKFNFGGGTTLDPFLDDGVRLQAADVFFRVNGAIRYGIPLTSHEGLLEAGALYSVNSGEGVLTAQQVLQLATGYAYRAQTAVWLQDDDNGSITMIAPGSIAVAAGGNGVTAGRVQATVSFAITPEFVASLNSRTMVVDFSSATCGNDILSFGVDPGQNPEPSTFLLMGGGLLILFRQRLQAAAPMIRRVFWS